MNWKSTKEKPQTTEPVTALIAERDAEDGPLEGKPYLVGIYYWEDGQWIDEMTGARLPPGEHYWLAEDELLAGPAGGCRMNVRTIPGRAYGGELQEPIRLLPDEAVPRSQQAAQREAKQRWYYANLEAQRKAARERMRRLNERRRKEAA